MTASTSKRRPRSPSYPSVTLETCYNHASTVYSKYSHAVFTKEELASALSRKASSGSFWRLSASMSQFGLIEKEGHNYRISSLFLALNTHPTSSPEFKEAAFKAIINAPVFRQLIEEFKPTIPPRETVATRLETTRKFNKGSAEKASSVFDQSLTFAGVLDSKKNLLPIRTQAGLSEEPPTDSKGEQVDPGFIEGDKSNKLIPPSTPSGYLPTVVPLGENRKVIVYYPPDLSNEEAGKVGRVLAAIVS